MKKHKCICRYVYIECKYWTQTIVPSATAMTRNITTNQKHESKSTWTLFIVLNNQF